MQMVASIVIQRHHSNAEARLRLGMFSHVRLLFSENHDSLTVPEQALFPVGDDQYLYHLWWMAIHNAYERDRYRAASSRPG
jgi:hypothetical protein